MKIALVLALFVVALLVSVEGGRWFRWRRKPKPDCSLPLDTGREECSRSPVERFYFNTETSECEAFQFTGCGGNSNSFSKLKKCQKKCEKGRGKGRPAIPVTRVTTTADADDDDSVPPS